MELSSPMHQFAFLNEARLLQIRFAQIKAERKSVEPGTGGSIFSETTFKVSQLKENARKALCVVICDAKGLPNKPKKPGEVAFNVIVEVRGVYEWKDDLSPEALKNDDVNGLLCQPLFLTASRKMTELLSDIGVGGAKMDLDIRAGPIEKVPPKRKVTKSSDGNSGEVLPTAKKLIGTRTPRLKKGT